MGLALSGAVAYDKDANHMGGRDKQLDLFAIHATNSPSVEA